ncbi:Shikimate 5-dehydrogenase I alpha, partial [uncultured Rubrobacteraceae bacterium]
GRRAERDDQRKDAALGPDRAPRRPQPEPGDAQCRLRRRRPRLRLRLPGRGSGRTARGGEGPGGPEVSGLQRHDAAQAGDDPARRRAGRRCPYLWGGEHRRDRRLQNARLQHRRGRDGYGLRRSGHRTLRQERPAPRLWRHGRSHSGRLLRGGSRRTPYRQQKHRTRHAPAGQIEPDRHEEALGPPPRSAGTGSTRRGRDRQRDPPRNEGGRPDARAPRVRARGKSVLRRGLPARRGDPARQAGAREACPHRRWRPDASLPGRTGPEALDGARSKRKSDGPGHLL